MARGNRMECTEKSNTINPFYVMELLEKAQELEARGEDVVHMEIGEPDFATPRPVRDAAVRAIEEGRTFYTHSLGLRELRERIAGHYTEHYGVSVSPDRVIVTNGTSGAFFLLSAVLLDRKRDLVISDPGYPCYRNFGALFDAPVISIPVDADSHFEITGERIEACTKRRFLAIICSPSNPTGTAYRRESIERLERSVREKEGILTVDEIYSGLTYDGPITTALSVSDDIIVINGFSKTYAMTGWRLGWMIVPEALIRPMQRVAQNVFISAPTVAQHAALRAFDAAVEIEEMKRTYRERREFLFPRLKELGFGLPAWPEGAFYIYADIGRWGMDSMKFVEKALLEAKVAITPGYDFGSYRAGSHVRFSYASAIERLRLGCERLAAWLATL